MLERDTSAEARAVQIAVWRKMTGSQLVELAAQMSEDARETTRAGIRARHPDYEPQDVEHALRRLILGDALFSSAWPNAPRLPA